MSKMFATLLCSVVTTLLLSTQAIASDTPPEKAVGISGAADAIGTVDLALHTLHGATGEYELAPALSTLHPVALSPATRTPVARAFSA